MILLPAEVPNFLPNFTLTAAELRVLISQAEAIATGPTGSCGNLEQRQYTEKIDISDAGLGHLYHCPITEIECVEMRGYAGPNAVGLDCWCKIEADQYEICGDEISIKCYSRFRGDGFGRNLYGRSRRPMQQRQKVEAKVTYKAGYDFQKVIPTDWETTMDCGPERDCVADIVLMKSAIAGIMLYLQSERDALAAAVPSGSASSSSSSTDTGGLQGEVKRISIDGQYTKEWFEATDSSSSSSGSSTSGNYTFIKQCLAGGGGIESLLAVFKRFAPKQLPV